MKRLFILPAIALMTMACGGGSDKDTNDNMGEDSLAVEEPAGPSMAFFGEKITEEGAKDLASVVNEMNGKDSMNVKLSGQVDKVCQVKGCWMTMPYGEGESMRVSFRDYGFFVPKDIDGKQVVVEGTVYLETTSVEDLKHYAEDEGQSAEEIAMITEPETALNFVADGVVVKDYKVKTDAAVESEQHMEHDHDHGGGDHQH